MNRAGEMQAAFVPWTGADFSTRNLSKSGELERNSVDRFEPATLGALDMKPSDFDRRLRPEEINLRER